MKNEETRKPGAGKFQKHISILMWKSYLQRQRRWRLLAIETAFAVILFLIAIFIARPVFLTPLEAEPEQPLSTKDILSYMQSNTLLGYAPNRLPYSYIMDQAADVLNIPLLAGNTESELNDLLYNKSLGTPINLPVIWVIFKPKAGNIWKFSIRSTERARYSTSTDDTSSLPNPHLHTGFLAVQVAISRAIVDYVSEVVPDFEVNLVSMPVSPLMQQNRVRQALSLILLCFTLAFLPATLETQALVVWETQNMFKRALRMRNVSYTSMYLSWLVYAYLTALPVCVLGAVTMILTFRWIHLMNSMLILFAYLSVMAMVALVMAMFHNNSRISCIWTTLFTLLQTYLAELLVHHQYDSLHVTVNFVLHVLLPPLGLINAFNEFALLSTGHQRRTESSIEYMLLSWGLLIIFYFGLLMLLQRTIGQQRAIGGQVSWRSIIFKQAKNQNALHRVSEPVRSEFRKLQEVDEFVAKAISFRDVCKDTMRVPVLHNLTFDIYRGEYTVMFAQKIQEKMIDTLDDVLTGLALPDRGEIRILGEVMDEFTAPLNTLYMMGYCHRSETLVDDLTVEEHFTLFTTICLWYEDTANVVEYGHIRYKQLVKECNLVSVAETRVRDLDHYYRAQLCWAIAMLIEPRVVLIPNLQDEPVYRSVIVDKIVQFRKYMTIVRLLFSSLETEYADRVFIFDSNILIFGGTPAYMFFRYGRDYRVRLTLRSSNLDDDPDDYKDLLTERVERAGGSVRAYLGSLIILRVPAVPSEPFAELITDLTDNADKYGVTSSISINVADSEEVVRRAITETRSISYQNTEAQLEGAALAKVALKRYQEPKKWTRLQSPYNCHFKFIARKFITFHKHHRVLLLLTVLTVEHVKMRTNLVVRADNSPETLSIVGAYVMSETKATEEDIEKIFYMAVPHTESLKEYLVTRAIDSPQTYVYVYAYGMDVAKNENETILISALYSPLHPDKGAAARSLARVYMALIRHYTGELDATIQVEDDPLALDLSPWMKDLAQPPLFLQFLLILTISHITLLPSKEYGLIRHIQKHAMNFSPLLYWGTLYLCDILFFWLLVAIMSIMTVSIIYLTAPPSVLQIQDMLALPFMLTLYGVGCIPQAYIFSLGPRLTLNFMTFVIVNMVFGETTILAKLLYGDMLSYALNIMNLSPQFNMAYAYVKIKQIFLYNSECVIFKIQNLCSSNDFHKCCNKCGVLQECFTRRTYLSKSYGIVIETMALLATAVIFGSLLLLIEYRIFVMVWKFISRKLYYPEVMKEKLNAGVLIEISNVIDKKKSIVTRRRKSSLIKVDTFGEYICAENLSRRDTGLYVVRSAYLGLGRGGAQAISGLKRHGRLDLLEILSGYRIPCVGNVWAMSKWNLATNPHKYSRQVSISCENPSLPPWMTMQESLELIAALRGVPERHIKEEVRNLVEALELTGYSQKLIADFSENDLTRVHFVAAVIGAPPVIIVDEVTAWQKFSVRRSIYKIMYILRKQGHAIICASSNIENHMPVTSRRFAFMIDGSIYDIDTIESLIERYSPQGFTVVLHLKNEVDVVAMFSKYFNSFKINDYSEFLVNVQVYDPDLNWKTIFTRMETLLIEHGQVYSYIATVTSIDYIFNFILSKEKGLKPATGFASFKWFQKIISSKPKAKPSEDDLKRLKSFEIKYAITELKHLPWSVIFQSNVHNDH
ncbi:unnamed protein product [Arctia plantaginis]|uniref:ABC transporter domain-containing protein n=1 Tax=Arctia plantaginis TaxID=874455 RepID=A0A8S1A6C6_ARCPL|nr:unnamed protein product [Arctia plantaginis]